MEMTKERVVVVGGGVIGICCSYFLAKRGLRVTMIERNGICLLYTSDAADE